MKLNSIIVFYIILILNFWGCTSVMSADKKEGIIEINFPDSIKGSVKVLELDSAWHVLDSVQIVNGKCIIKYAYREMSTIAHLMVYENANDVNPEIIWMKNPYSPSTPCGDIVLDNSHIVIDAAPRMKSFFFCTCENAKNIGEGCLDITFPDSIHGLVYLQKFKKGQHVKVDSACIMNGKCVFNYNMVEVTDDPVFLFVEQTKSLLIPENGKNGAAWNSLLKTDAPIKVNAVPRMVTTGIIATVSGSPETEIQLQLMSNLPACRDIQGHISNSYIQKHPNSKLLFNEVFYNRSNYPSIESLKRTLSLFSDECRQSSKGKELELYIKQKEEYDKFGIKRTFSYFDVEGNKYNFNDCVKDKQLCLIVFWASWCGPCLNEIPHLKEFYKKYKDDVAFVSLSVDEDYKKWAERMKQYPVEWLNLSGLPESKKKVVNSFGITTVPNFMIVNRAGKIISSQYIMDGNKVRLIELDDVKNLLDKELRK